ncbi:MAG: hypothetical protein QGG42_11245 [Phycisphaerae bacterium]|jgi:hypothetical protein|nr:hypothetical protein [Phycisphaerae bacterium]
MARRLLARRNKGSVVRAGLKSAWIIFGTIGLVLWIVAAIPPNSRAFCAGYWIHARVWVDVDEIRTWAAERSPSTDKYEPIDAEQWPESLRRVSVSGGVVTCDPKTLTVIFYEGGQYGHWGLTVAPPGSTPSDSVYTVRLEDGAWVWCE